MLELLATIISAGSIVVAVLSVMWQYRCHVISTRRGLLSIILMMLATYNFAEHLASIEFTEIIITNLFIISAIYVNGCGLLSDNDMQLEVGINRRRSDRRRA